MIQTSQYQALSLQLNDSNCTDPERVIEEAKKAVCSIREVSYVYLLGFISDVTFLKHSEECHKWLAATNLARSDELHQIREERKRA